MLKCKYFRKDGTCSKFDPEKYKTKHVAWRPLVCPFDGDVEKCHEYAMDLAIDIRTQLQIEEMEIENIIPSNSETDETEDSLFKWSSFRTPSKERDN